VGRNINIDARGGGASPYDIFFGDVEYEPTILRHDGAVTVFPIKKVVGIANGKTTLRDVAPSPAGPEPAWAYRVTFRDRISNRSFTEIVGVPDGTIAINYPALPRFTKMTPPGITAEQLQNWVDSTEANADRAEAAAAAAEAPTDSTVGTLIDTPQSQAAMAMDRKLIDTLGPLISGNPLTVYGHSYTIVPGAYVSTNGEWSTRLTNMLGVVRKSHGASGARMIEIAAMAIGNAVPGAIGNRSYTAGQPGIIAVEGVMNDALSGPATAAGRKGFENALRAFLATTTAAQRIESTAAATTGTWSTFTNGICSGGTSRYTAVNGNTLTFENVNAPGGKAYILTFCNQQDASKTGSITVAVDGVDQGITYTGEGQMEQFASLVSGSGWPAYAHAVIPVNVPATGTHSIKVTKTGAAYSVYVDALLVPGAVPPPVLVFKDPPVGELTTQARQDAWAANSPLLHGIVDSVAAEFPTATVVDLGRGWVPATMASTEDAAKFHPNDIGMQHIADTAKWPLIDAILQRLRNKMWA